MRKLLVAALCGSVSLTALAAESPAWVEKSDAYTKTLLDIQNKHAPESASREGLAEFDAQIRNPTLAAEKAERKELEAAVAKLKVAAKSEKDPNVQQDLEIIFKAFDLQFREQDYRLAHEVPFINASSRMFGSMQGLLDDQVAAERRPAALIRLRKYAGLEKGYKPYTELLKARVTEQMAKPDMIYPSKQQIETEMSRNANYLSGIKDLFVKYQIKDWEKPYEALAAQLTAYDAWVRETVLPKARTDFRMPDAKYALAFEGYGIDIPPAKVAEMAHAAFSEIQGQMIALAPEVAKEKGWTSTDYRDVITQLKKNQITGDAILPFFENRLKDIEKIIVAQNLVTLPSRPAIIKLGTAAESAQQPAPHMVPPPFLHNTGQRGVFVLPLNIPGADGQAGDKYDDFTYDAASWTLTAHEARPGHELQFDSMVEHGVSKARALYAFNSTNAEGWGLYSEYIMQPFEPKEAQMITLQLRLQRAARAFLDPELQSGKVTPEQAYQVLEHDVMLSHGFAKQEVERYTYRSPGQANSYFYGFTRIMALRKEVEAALGAKFDQKKFHDFMLAQGLLPPDLMRKAVMTDFVPSQK